MWFRARASQGRQRSRQGSVCYIKYVKMAQDGALKQGTKEDASIVIGGKCNFGLRGGRFWGQVPLTPSAVAALISKPERRGQKRKPADDAASKQPYPYTTAV